MRILSLPIALLLAACLYLPFPRTVEALADVTKKAYARFLSPFTRKYGKTDEALALVLFLLLIGGVCQLIGGLHIALAGAMMAPLFCTFSMIPQAASIKEQLDSGVFARNAGEYDARVRSACAAFGPSFVADMCAPLLLIALGTPLHLGCALGGAYFTARLLGDQCMPARRIVAMVTRPAGFVLRMLLLLCSGVVGRSPTQAHGEDVRTLMLSLLGIAGDAGDTHAPISGDIAQAILLGCFANALLTLALCMVLYSFC